MQGRPSAPSVSATGSPRSRICRWGSLSRPEYRQFAAKLAMGDVVIIYTDAMTEARNPAREMLDERGLLELAQRTVEQGSERERRARGTSARNGGGGRARFAP
jgi:hypothetical protein